MVCVWSLLLCRCGGGGGCSYRETWFHLYTLQSASLIGEDSNLGIIYSEARRGYREVGLSGGSFTETQLMNRIPSDLTRFSVFCSRLQSVLQKSSGQPRLPTVDGNYTIINLWTADDF